MKNKINVNKSLIENKRDINKSLTKFLHFIKVEALVNLYIRIFILTL